ncbi:J domain-containing protein [Luteibacter aegosomatissinici]|uniref:J domain-containing protein n=1 Tax=Luteibacter aegosomatissinici TaxID=2911539 RepID=UPI001FFC2646|nr:J domain-containing protein [Luteibacter aegosomatissinici]UPG96610.1 J domain-containing protein [Luteibacter aegosomatissinici]
MSLTDIVVIALALFIGYKFTAAMLVDSRETADAPRVPPASVKRPWHEVLNVAPDASREQIVDAYRRLIREHHPDRVANLGKEFRDLAERRASEINVAYDEALQQLG